MERPHGELTSRDSEEEVQQLKAEIHENQAALQDTVAEIQERLSPSHLKEQATNTMREATVGRVEDMMSRAGDKVEQAAETTRRAATAATQGVRDNPIPYALIGIGMAWLFASTRRDRSSMFTNYGNREDYRKREDYRSREWPETSVASSTDSEAAWGAASVGYDTSRTSVEYDTSRTSGLRTAFQARRWNVMLRENPMVMAAAALAAGAVVGAALPATDIENEYLGETRDSMLESARAIAETAAQKLTGEQV